MTEKPGHKPLLRRHRKRPSLTARIMLLAYRWLSPIIKRPGVTMATGFSLLVTGGAELWETIDPASETYLDSSHGVILFGIVTAMRGFVEMVEGLEIMGIDAEIRHSRGTLDDDGGAG